MQNYFSKILEMAKAFSNILEKALFKFIIKSC
jgi:hypothetical protein